MGRSTGRRAGSEFSISAFVAARAGAHRGGAGGLGGESIPGGTFHSAVAVQPRSALGAADLGRGLSGAKRLGWRGSALAAAGH